MMNAIKASVGVRLTLGILIILMVSSGLHGGDSQISSTETELELRGVATDTESLLVALITHPDWPVRSMAARLLGLRKETVAGDTLVTTLETEENTYVRSSVAIALMNLGIEEGVAEARELLEIAESLGAKITLASRLAKSGDARGFHYVKQALDSEKHYDRLKGIDGLRSFIPLDGTTGEEAIRLLLEQLEDKHMWNRLNALVMIPFAHKHGASLDHLLPILRRLAENDPDEEIRREADIQLHLFCRGVLADSEPPASYCP